MQNNQNFVRTIIGISKLCKIQLVNDLNRRNFLSNFKHLPTLF